MTMLARFGAKNYLKVNQANTALVKTEVLDHQAKLEFGVLF